MASEIEKMKTQVSLLRIVSSAVQLERRGNEYWGCCPFHEERTPSFAVKVKDGSEVYFCQGCKAGGDVITWLEKKQGLSKKDAIAKLKEMTYDPSMAATMASNQADAEKYERVAGAFGDIVENNKPKIKVEVSKYLPLEAALMSNAPALKWLEEVRGINRETAQALRLGYSQGCKGFIPEGEEHVRDKGWVLFPRFDEDQKQVIACKMRSIVSKVFSQWKNMDPKALFNAGAANALEDLYVTEGELDSCIMEQAGFRAVSIPNASTKLTPEMKAVMKRAARVFLAGDNDGSVGNSAMRALARELGSNTYLIEWPNVKDANDFFRNTCERNVELFQNKVTELAKLALSTPVENFTALITRLRQAGMADGTNAAGNPLRLHFPFPALDNMSYSAPGSVVTFYSTYSGTGKTVFVTQMMLAEAERGETVVVYSPEVRDEQYLALVAAQTLGPTRSGGLNRAGAITAQDYREVAQILDVPTQAGTEMQYYVGHSLPVSDGEKVLDFLETVIMATGATRFVIDTLHRLVVPSGRESVVDAEGRTMRRLEELAIKYGMIFIVIGQSNKEAEDLKEVRKDSHGTLRGNREIMDISDSVYLLHRKRNSEEPKEGVDLLENETSVVLCKGRVQGTTGKYCKMVYKKEFSQFLPMSSAAEPPSDGSFPGMESPI